MKNKGFSLIELLVVVAIIGILGAVGVVVYKGFIERSKESACIQQHYNIKEIIQLKFIEGRMESGPSIQHSDGTCFQYFMQFGQPGDIRQQIRENNASAAHCNSLPVAGGESLYAKEVWALGIRNCINKIYPPYANNCWDSDCSNINNCPAMGAVGSCAPGLSAGSPVPESSKVKGVTIFACGVQAGETNPNKCYLGTRVSDDKVIEEFITK